MNQQDSRSVHPESSREKPAVIEVRDVVKRFPVDDSVVNRLLRNREYVNAVSGVSFQIQRGETLALVGESGSGKSTIANVITGLHEPTSGEVLFDGESLGGVTDRSSEVLADIGMVFQDPKSSLDPRITVEQCIEEPLRSNGWSAERRRERVAELLELVNLSPTYADRHPHELSGGQAQRVAIARAVALDPQVLVLDEPVSALDVSVQAKILNLLMRLQDELDLTYLFIAHDLNVVEHIADRVAVMYLGQLMEVAPTAQLFEQPTHPYTDTLLSAIPDLESNSNTERVTLEGDIPSPVNPPDGCVFHTRCPVADEECSQSVPDFQAVGDAESKCHYAEEFVEGERAND
ncbi:ABC transporter ATP-binding protein [Halorussus halophilus]|uniref:ABC transporter ATP-binding protein n=1 Tax=Halorussus halophilus TaxID=2650975 RepID=UPI0013018355|nr:oligopeptide/dipeptide ABC transporter ATP-binding protein [Halorussus halophilus]